ncbi:MAG: two-component regulator propeller domain-containing protein [Bacteroidota bacterium]
MTNSKTVFKIITSYSLLILLVISCNEKNKSDNQNDTVTEQTAVPKKSITTLFKANIASEMDNNIRSFFQDKNNNYWFGTNSAGVYRYDGKTLIQFTEKDGLANNQIQSIQEDKLGNIWFGTGLFGVSRFNGETFSTFTNSSESSVGKGWKTTPNDLWFYAGGGVYNYNGNFTYLPLPKTYFDSNSTPNPPNRLSPYAVYSLLKDTKGNLWFGTQSMGVCHYDGTHFTWFTEKGLAGPAVLGLFEDSKGNLWFGNNGAGLFKYDGKSLTNFTKEKGLTNDQFVKNGKSGPGTLARIYAINEDNNGNLWIGTVDAGVWRYDGKKITNYTTKNGLTSNAINTIYKDKKGALWFGTDKDGVCKFNGTSFTKFVIK